MMLPSPTGTIITSGALNKGGGAIGQSKSLQISYAAVFCPRGCRGLCRCCGYTSQKALAGCAAISTASLYEPLTMGSPVNQALHQLFWRALRHKITARMLRPRT